MKKIKRGDIVLVCKHLLPPDPDSPPSTYFEGRITTEHRADDPIVLDNGTKVKGRIWCEKCFKEDPYGTLAGLIEYPGIEWQPIPGRN